MYRCLFLISFLYCVNTHAQPSAVDLSLYDVVLEDPGMKAVMVKKNIIYFEDAKNKLHIDIYSPPGMQAADKRPAIVFLNGLGDERGQRKIKDASIYTSWCRLMASQGYIGIAMESEVTGIQECMRRLFDFFDSKGSDYNIDKDKLGVYAASANVSQSSRYLMSADAYMGIKAAVLYYGRPPVGPFRKDLPVLFVIAEGDVNPGYNSLWSEVLKNNAPWSIKMATGMPHAFDANTDNDAARKIIKETISFWKSNLDPVPAPSWKYSKGRDILGSLQMNRPKAMSLFKSLTEENPGDIDALLFYANELRKDKNFAEAISIYRRALASDTKNAQAMVDLAVLLYMQNQDKEAEAYVASAVNTGNIKRGDYAELGFYLLAANKNKEAAGYYEKALAIGEDGFDYYYLARAYSKANDKDNAIRALERSLKIGYGSRQQIEKEADFDPIRSDDKFKQLASSLK